MGAVIVNLVFSFFFPGPMPEELLLEFAFPGDIDPSGNQPNRECLSMQEYYFVFARSANRNYFRVVAIFIDTNYPDAVKACVPRSERIGKTV